MILPAIELLTASWSVMYSNSPFNWILTLQAGNFGQFSLIRDKKRYDKWQKELMLMDCLC